MSFPVPRGWLSWGPAGEAQGKCYGLQHEGSRMKELLGDPASEQDRNNG